MTKLLEPLETAKTLGYLSQQIVDRGLVHADELIEAVQAYEDESVSERGFYRHETAFLQSAALDFKKAFYKLKEAHNRGAALEKEKGVRDWIPSDWPGIGGGR